MTAPPDALTAVAIALERLSAAMATGRFDAVLAAEEPLAEALRRLMSCPAPGGADRALVIDGVRGVRTALLKCQLLGRASASLAQAMAPHSPYTVRGHRGPSNMPATLQSRT
jgi:hypothetical protein